MAKFEKGNTHGGRQPSIIKQLKLKGKVYSPREMREIIKYCLSQHELSAIETLWHEKKLPFAIFLLVKSALEKALQTKDTYDLFRLFEMVIGRPRDAEYYDSEEERENPTARVGNDEFDVFLDGINYVARIERDGDVTEPQ